MHWKFDIDQRSLEKFSLDNTASSVKAVKLAFPDKYKIQVDFFRSKSVFSFTGTLKATVKPINQQTGLALATTSVPVTGDSVSFVLDMGTTQMLDFVQKFGERPAALELLVIDADGYEIASWTVNADLSRRYTGVNDVAYDLPDLKATFQDAELGTSNTKWMTPLRTWDAIRKWATDFFKWGNLQEKPLTFPPSPHIHTEVIDIQQALSKAGIEVI
jgi:hypothetical protein